MTERFDDDLRDFAEHYVKPEEPEVEVESFDKKNYFKENDEKLDAMLDVSKDIKKLRERVDALEVLNYGLWIMLEKKGFTNEEYDEALKEAKEKLLAKFTAKKETVKCPKCGKQLQAADIFGIKCIYCGYEQVANPYQTPKEESDEIPVEFEAYDVTKDLGFDEEV